MSKPFQTTIKIVLIILFLLCLFQMPYVFYQFVRTIGMVGFVLLAYYDSFKKDKTLMIIWIFSAIIINPIFKIALGRALWNAIDILWAVLLLGTIIYEIHKNKVK
jgi:hypothetical protein